MCVFYSNSINIIQNISLVLALSKSTIVMGKHCVKMTSYERKVVEDDVCVPGCPGRVSVMCCVAWPG